MRRALDPLVIERHITPTRRHRPRVTYRFRQGSLLLAAQAPTRERAEYLARDLAEGIGVLLFYRHGGPSGPAQLIADYSRSRPSSG